MAQRLPPLQIDARNVSIGSLADKYDVGQVIGTGSFGKAILARSIENESLYVIKQIKIADLQERERQEAITEVKLLAQFDHINVIKYYECIVEDGTLNIVMEYAKHGELSQQIAARATQGTPFTEDEVMFWFVQIAAGLCHVHSKNVLHRDLKSQNIFIAEGNILKLGDFGIARLMKNDQDLARTAIGTPYYLSPEICEDKPYNAKSDVWALGCILYELCTLRRAFDGHSLPALVVKILRGKYPPIPQLCTEPIRRLIDSMLTQNPKNRPTVDNILRNEYVQNHLARYAKHVMQLYRDKAAQHAPILDTLSMELRKAVEMPSAPSTPPIGQYLRGSMDRAGIASLTKNKSPPAKPPEESEDEAVSNSYQLNLWKMYGNNPPAANLGQVSGKPGAEEVVAAEPEEAATEAGDEEAEEGGEEEEGSEDDGDDEDEDEEEEDDEEEGGEEEYEDDWHDKTQPIKGRHHKKLVSNSWLSKQQDKVDAIMAALSNFKKPEDDESFNMGGPSRRAVAIKATAAPPAPSSQPSSLQSAPGGPTGRQAAHPPHGPLSQAPPSVPPRRAFAEPTPPVSAVVKAAGLHSATGAGPAAAAAAKEDMKGVKLAVADALAELKALQAAQFASKRTAAARSRAAINGTKVKEAPVSAATLAAAAAKKADKEAERIKAEKHAEMQLQLQRKEEEKRRREQDAAIVHQKHLEHMKAIQAGDRKADLARIGNEFAKRGNTPPAGPQILIVGAPPARGAAMADSTMNHVIRKTASQGGFMKLRKMVPLGGDDDE